jgi:YidC/Oxa1 family membrane protein insertase
LSRDAALAESIANSMVSRSINLRGGRIDDLCLVNFSPRIVLLSPSGTPHLAEFDLLAAQGTAARGPDTGWWTASAGAKLSFDTLVTLTYANGAGLVFTRGANG